MTENEYNKNWNTKEIVEETMKHYHNEPSPETRERLSTLETTQEFMVKEISEIKEIVKEIKTTLTDVMECKASKDEVETLHKKVDQMEIDSTIWKTRVLVIGSVLLFLITFFKETLLNFFK